MSRPHAGTDPRPDASNNGVTPGTHVPPSADQTALPELPDPYGMLAQSLADRGALVRLCLYALDRARSDGIAERIEHGLAAVGIAPVRPDGEPFDPALHEAGGTVPTDDVGLAGTIAATEVVGFTDNGRVLRVPVVIVHRLRDNA